MKINVNLNPEIFNFKNLQNETQIIEKHLFDKIKDFDFMKELPEWTIEINVQLGKGTWAGIYKKGITTPSMFIRRYTIFLPIPSNKEIEWGVNEKKYVKQPPRDSSKFNISELNYSNYNNITDYIIEESYLLINSLFKSGIKLKNLDFKI